MNQLKVNQQQSILLLHEQGWSKRRIALELALDRGTVPKYLAGAAPKPATNPHIGSDPEAASKSPGNPHTGSASEPETKPATNPRTGSTARQGPASVCEPWQAQIQQGLAQGLSVQRIYQDLVTGQRFAGSSVSGV